MSDEAAHSTGAGSSPAALAIVTGAAQRIGAAIARRLHAQGYDLLLHCHRSQSAAESLAHSLNALRPGSARVVRADLRTSGAANNLFAAARGWHAAGAEVLVNNASSFYPTAIGALDEQGWEDLRRTNLDAPLWLSQAFASQPSARGCIINLLDAMVPRGIVGFAPYAAAKAGLENLSRSLAKELAPAIRVNAVAPGAIFWPEPPPSSERQQAVLAGIPLGRLGRPEDIADAVAFLVAAPYITGQVLAVDGGRGL